MVPGQLPPPSERPADMEVPPAPPAVIPPTVQFYAQAAASSPLDGADWVYVAKGGAQRPLPGVGEGEQGVEAAGGGESGGGQPGPLEASPRQCGPRAAVPSTRGRPRTASVAPVASSSSTEKPGGPV